MSRIDVSSLGAYIKEQRTSAELSIRELAKVAGVSNPYLSQIERGIRQPSAQTLTRVAEALRISVEQLYVRAGLLDRGTPSSVHDAIEADPDLTPTQQTLLVELYEQFISTNAAAAESAATAKQLATKTSATKTATKSTAKKSTAKTTTEPARARKEG